MIYVIYFLDEFFHRSIKDRGFFQTKYELYLFMLRLIVHTKVLGKLLSTYEQNMLVEHIEEYLLK